MRTLLTGLLVFFTGFLHANTTCIKAKSIREIDIVYSKPGYKLPCEVTYKKSESPEIQILWKAKNQPGYCEQKAKDFIATFETKDWICQSNSEASAPQEEKN